MKTRGFYLMAMIPMLACCFSLFAQESPNVVPVSPEAAALAKMVNYPVNMNTGIPDINIPFYEIKVGGMSLPITLNYHAGGFKINEQATRAGLGWSLSSDLQVTRSINGLDDLNPGKGYISNNLMKAYYSNSTTCSSCPYPLWSTSPFPFANAYDLAMGQKDGMPDKFNYKLLGKSGSFYFQKNDAGTSHEIVPVPYDNIRIVYDNGRFIITDSDGTVYYFGETGGGVDLDNHHLVGREFSGDLTGGSSVTAWKCKKIVNATGTDQINFSYVRKSVATYSTYFDEVVYYSNDDPYGLYVTSNYMTSEDPPLDDTDDYELIKSVPFYKISSPKYWVRFAGNATSYLHVPYVSGGAFVDKAYARLNSTGHTANAVNSIAGLSLSEITFRGGKVVFNGANELSSIRVLDGKNTEIKSLHFFHSFQQAIYVPESKHYNGLNFQGTMYLDSLHLRNGSSTYERYALVYKNKFCYGNHLKGQDAWGYPNANTVEIAYVNNTNGHRLSIPTKDLIHPSYRSSFLTGGGVYSNLPISIGGDNWAEAVDEEAMQQGILKRIIYPTGGFVDFDFEANRYEEDFDDGWREQRLPQLSGGLRVRSISYYDAENEHPINYRPVSQQYYRYGDLEQGTGLLVNKPRLAPGPYITHYDAVSHAQEVVYIYYDPINPFPNPCIGKPCMKLMAVETKTTYRTASTLDYTYAGGAPIYYTKVSEYRRDLGRQTGKTVHEYYPPEKFFYDNHALLRLENRVPGTNVSYLKTDGLMGALKSVTQYKALLGFAFEPVHRKYYEYTRYLKPQQVQVAYAFPRVLYEEVLGSGSQEQIVYYDNSKDFQGGGYYSPPSDEYIAEEYGIPVGRLLMTKEEQTHYERGDSLVATTTYYYNNLPYLQPSKITTTDSRWQTVTKTILYPYNFPGIQVYDQMADAVRINLPIEEVETRTGTASEISRRRTDYQSYSAGFGFIAPSALRSSVKGQPLQTDVSFDLYDDHANVRQMTSRDGVTTSYLWGYEGLYPVAELRGISYAGIPATYKGNAQIYDPSSDASLRSLLNGLYSNFTGANDIKTYTYKRLMGMSSMTESGGRVSSYEYDPIGRLSFIKDHGGKIVNRYEYNMKGPNTWNLTPNHSTNIPVMRTHYVGGAGSTIQPFNYIVEGGTHISTNMDHAIIVAENEANEGLPVPDLPPGTSSSNLAHIELTSIFMEDFDLPGRVEIDFIRDGSVVATTYLKQIAYLQTPDYDDLYLPEGEYQISVRPNANMRYTPSGLLYYYISTQGDPTGVSFRSGQKMTFSKNKTYVINIANL